MELRINKEQISHITVYDLKKGVKFYYSGYVPYVWMDADYFKFLWIFKTPIKNFDAGYFKDCKRKWIANDTPFEIEREKHLVINKSLWTKPHIEIFCGKEKIKTVYFESLDLAKEYCNENFNNVNVIIN